MDCIALIVPPRFTKELTEKTLTLPVGSSTAIELPFAASPQPKVTWTFNGGKLPDPKRFKTDTISAMTSLTMAKLVRKDAGKYAVALENEHGKCELVVTLVVLGMKMFSCSVIYTHAVVVLLVVIVVVGLVVLEVVVVMVMVLVVVVAIAETVVVIYC